MFRVTEGLEARFGSTRCFDSPLAESAIVGSAIGMALRGFRPVAEIQFDGFTYPAFDQMASHLAKYRTRTRGLVSMPVTVRVPSFGGIGSPEHHSESTESLWVHTAGLKVVVPSNPADAYWLLRDSIELDDPVIYLEPKRRYWAKGDLDRSTRQPPVGSATVARPGTTVSVVTYGGLVGVALEAANVAAADHGWDLEVIDLRSLVPLDFDAIAASVVKTGRCIVMHEGPRSLGMGAEIAARVQEELFWNLEAPVLARHRLRHAVPARSLRGGVAAGRRPAPRLRRALALLRPCLTRRTSSCPTWARAWRTRRSCRGPSPSATPSS